MTIDFNAIRQAIASEGAPSLEGSGILRGSGGVEQGEAMGFHVETQPDAAAMLADSLEEISSMFEETEVKNMGDREIGDKRKTENRYTARVRFWTNKLSDMPNSDVIARILRRIRNAGMTTPEQLLGKEASLCSQTPEESRRRIVEHLRRLLPDASEKQLLRLVK